MNEQDFWTLVESTAPASGAGTETHVARIVDALAARPDGDIVAFHTHLSTAAGRACRWDLWGVAYVAMGGCSDDSFDYFRMWLVAQGRAYFERALDQPERAADRITQGVEADCESLDYAAARAWERNHDGEFPYDEAEAAVPERDVDIAGEPFDEDTVHELYPDVARRFAEAAAPGPPTDVPGGLRFVTWSPDGSLQAIIEGAYQPEHGDRIRADARVRGLQFSPGHESHCDVGFLPSLPQLRRFSIGLGKRCDVSAVSDCPWLESVIVGACPGKIDVSGMAALRDLYVEGPRHEAAVLAATQLEELIWGKTSLTDLRGLSRHTHLLQLSLSGGKLVSTAGLGKLSSLEILGLSRLRSLAEIVELGDVRTLVVLSIDGVNVAPRMEDVALLVHLERLELDIDVELPSIRPIAACTSLRRATLQGVRIADGRIAFLAELPNIADAYVSPARGCDVTNAELRRRVLARR